mgnify:CR=1 FL=1
MAMWRFGFIRSRRRSTFWSGILKWIIGVLDLAFKDGIRLDLQRGMHDVAFDMSSRFQFHLAGADRATNFALHLDDLSFDFACDEARGADRDVSRADVAVNDTINLQSTFGDDRAIDLHVRADDRCCARRGFHGCPTDGVLCRRAFDHKVFR